VSERGTASTIESPAKKYLEENFGMADFFRNQETGEWYSPLLETLYEDVEVREAIDYMNILSIHGKNSFGRVGDVNIGEVSKEDLIMGSFFSYYAANDLKSGKKMGYFQNPLFSDVAAMVLLKLPRYSDSDIRVKQKGGYKKVIVELLERTFE